MSPWPKAPRPNHKLIIISGFPRSSKPMGSPYTQASLHTWVAHVTPKLACTHGSHMSHMRV
ncbi:hypothetical protein GIB67_042109 [Kingdonia uniflora]|uniref:Uncharacterized protein n=1 Tax=Kingdonia uniflora TaxID=39325 RepID=A0A7J7NPC1_9MAGN|nr:hypothetical protein GIB67_042109 [Kingdonia uniflora]